MNFLRLRGSSTGRSSFEYTLIIVNRPRNNYETVGNIEVGSTDSLKQLEVANKVDYFTN